MKHLNIITIVLLSLGLFSGCKDSPIEDFDIIVGQNTVSAVAETNDNFALALNGTFDLNINGNNYGSLFAEANTDTTPFRFGATANFEAFLGDTWDGFEPTTSLPNGDPLPGWITPYELVAVSVPNFSEVFNLTFYAGFHAPYYLGVAIELKFFDQGYPNGLNVFQNIRKDDGEIVATVVLYGPTFDDQGAVVQHGGIFFVATFDKEKQGHLDLGNGLELGKLSFEGEAASEYRNDKEKQKKLMKTIKNVIDEFNRHVEGKTFSIH